MFGEKCSLCGGRLDGRGMCTECGLDNSKSEKNYKVNHSDCDDMPLTHVHEDTDMNTQETPKPQATQQYSGPIEYVPTDTEPRNSTSKVRWIPAIFFAAILLIVGINVVATLGIMDFARGDVTTYSEEDYDPYEYVEAELPSTGDSMELSLTSGQYIVGIHIPAGNYEAVTADDFDTVSLTDDENGIYLFEYTGKDEKTYLDDLRLYDGAVVTIYTESPVQLMTENAQPVEEGIENPVQEGFTVADGQELTAGEDFEPGIYDVIDSDGSGMVDIQVPNEEDEEYSYTDSYSIGDLDGNTFHYMVIPEGAVISCTQVSIELAPTEQIRDTNYMEFYNYY